jgi:hypothetical protein
MTNTRSLIEKIAKSVFAKILRIRDQARAISLSPRRCIFPRWFTWKKILFILVVLPWGMLAALYIHTRVVYHTTLFPHSVPIRIWNSHRIPRWISYVGIDGRRLSDDFGNYEYGLGLGEMTTDGPSTARLTYGDRFIWDDWNMQSGTGMITPNISHRLVLHVRSPPSSAKKVYSCELVVPRQSGFILIELLENNKISCMYHFTPSDPYLG